MSFKMKNMKQVQILLIVLLLGFSVSAKEYHVAKTGNNNNPGTAEKPFLTIQAAGNMAQPGDEIIVHAGIYRERISPPRGGTSNDKRIVYRAAEGQSVEIKGSEIIKNWERFKGDVWKVTIPNTFFGDYNPYQDKIVGDWFNSLGRVHHTGEVYLNGKSLYEAESLDEVLSLKMVVKPEMLTPLTDTLGATFTWFCEVKEGQTIIYANFHGANPNAELVEINVRESCFYPDKPGINYLTVSGFTMSQAATQWAAPTAEQPGLIGTHWSKGWIIENNIVSDSKCVGITLGKDRATGHNVWINDPAKDGSIHYNEVVVKAIENGWSRDNIGSHKVRNNTIFNCGVAGICGSLGGIFSEITNNHIYDIWTKRLFSGPEKGGIKIHAAIDMLIEGNRIHNAYEGIWLDWMAQGTRVSKNLCYDNDNKDFFAEVNHGPYIVDNNIFLSEVAIWDWSNGGAYLHNLIAGKIYFNPQSRETPWFKPHSTELGGIRDIKGGDTRYINNILAADPTGKTTVAVPFGRGGKADYGLSVYDSTFLPMLVEGNVYLKDAKPYRGEPDGAVFPEYNPAINLINENGNLYLEMSTETNITKSGQSLVTTSRLGKAVVPAAYFVNYDGSAIEINTDYFGNTIDPKNVMPGPFQNIKKGSNLFEVWP